MRKRAGSACHDVSFFPLEEGQPPGPVEDITHIVFATAYQNENFDSDTPITRSVIDGNRRGAMNNIASRKQSAVNMILIHAVTPQPICGSTVRSSRPFGSCTSCTWSTKSWRNQVVAKPRRNTVTTMWRRWIMWQCTSWQETRAWYMLSKVSFRTFVSV